jgi:hypothetical protein
VLFTLSFIHCLQTAQVLDPQLHALFEARECLNYFFAFRWLLIHFKREFPFDQVRCIRL